MIEHIRCGNLAEKEGVTLGYDFYCPSCDEDLCLTECRFETLDGLKTYEEITGFVNSREFSLCQDKDKGFVGYWRGERSPMYFDWAVDCYVHCYDSISNGYKSL